jgi:SAM-dependent methyltransferase
MEAYGKFAEVYDLFMDNVDYESWSAFLTEQLKAYGISDGLVLDLGCGTGTMTELLAEAGYDMIGVDNSEDMLAEAMEKRVSSGHDILYLLQDMQEFELYGTVRAIVSVCDSLNYLTEEEDLQQVFRLVNNYLDPDGMFLFDMNTEYKYRELMGDNVIAENREDGSFIWENSYDPKTGINVYELALFLPRTDGLYEKCEEEHYERFYPVPKVRELLEAAGLELKQIYNGYTSGEPEETSERLLFIAGKKSADK